MSILRWASMITALATTVAVGVPPVPASADGPVALNVSIDPTAVGGATMGADFLGLSIETGALSTPQLDGTRGNLASLLSTLGTPTLRLGGNSADATAWLPNGGTTPSWAKFAIGPSDLQRFQTLVQATGARVILGVALAHYDPDAAAQEAAAAQQILGSSLIGIEVGNEPNAYSTRTATPGPGTIRPSTYSLSDYQTEFNAYKDKIAAAAPGLPVVGPASYSGPFLAGFSLGGQNNAIVTQHIYPQNACGGPTPTITTMLSRGAAKNEAGQMTSGLAVASANGATLRIGESNNVVCSGQGGVSDRFASALWAVDYLSLGASLGVAGINLHTGSLQQCGPGTSPAYALLCATTTDELNANVQTPQPEWYGLQLLRPLVGSTFVPASYSTNRNIVVRAAKDPAGVVRVIVDDMDTDGSAASNVSLALPPGYKIGHVQRLQAASLDSPGPVTFGGDEVIGSTNGAFPVTVPAASAALVTLTTDSVTPTVSVSVAPASGSTAGSPAVVTTTVTGPGTVPAATGPVTVSARGGALSGCVNVPLKAVAAAPTQATATCTTKALPLGTTDVTAAYSGDTLHYNPATGALARFSVKTQASAFTKANLLAGDGEATMSFALAAQRSGPVSLTLTATAKGHPTRTAHNRSASGTLKVTGLKNKVRYAFRLSVTRSDGFSATKTVYATPIPLPTPSLRAAQGRVPSGAADLLSGTLTNAGKPVGARTVILTATVGKRSVIVGRARTDALGRFAFTQRPRVTTTFVASYSSGKPGHVLTTKSKPQRVTVP